MGPRLRFRLGLRWQIALLGTCGVLLVGGTVGFNENSGLEGNLREAVHQIEARLAEFDEPRLTILMLMMRRHEKDFLLRGDEKYGADITKRGEEFVKALDASAIGAPVRDELEKLLDRYQSSFMSLMVGRGMAERSAGLHRVMGRCWGGSGRREIDNIAPTPIATDSQTAQ